MFIQNCRSGKSFYCRLVRHFSAITNEGGRGFSYDKPISRALKIFSVSLSTKGADDDPFLPIKNAFRYGSKAAIYDQHGKITYISLTLSSLYLADKLKTLTNLQGERIAFLTPNDASYMVSMWSTWLSGAIAVPLCKSHPSTEIEHVLQDCKPKVVLSTPEYSEMIDSLAKKHGIIHHQLTNVEKMDKEAASNIDSLQPHDNALIIYTSGTTGRPKGALWNHKNLTRQIKMMIHAWEWSDNDTILHLLPLHHIHGVVNTLMCPLLIGGTVVMKNKFDPGEVWDHLLGKAPNFPDISVFMAVPTIYMKLMQHFEKDLSGKQDEVLESCKKIRLMVSGSASLPTPVFHQWKSLTSHDLLERYGMTEIGMALTNPYKGERIPGTVGRPFPGVQVKIVEDQTERVIVQGHTEDMKVTPGLEGQQGELLVRGPIFQEYWGKKDATQEAFTEDGWFKTGDTAEFCDGVFRIVGRASVDIIKSGGYKISALDVERHLLDHENIREVVVIGIPDETWGQRVAAIVSFKDPDNALTLDELRVWCKTRMAPYQAPTALKIVTEIKKNVMGKINKKELVKEFDREKA